ncbi:MAG: cytochrome c-type biogenesis protein CcmH [Thermoleophilaceae bacterium]|nr:cytochrome c-type biogenesis protein CcmH [Thermoleophilaceae bacterium]
MSRLAAPLVAMLAALAIAPAALAADCPRTTLGDIEDEVMCPVCGTPLELATEAPQANRERAYIQRLIDDCRSKDEVKQALVAQFGDRVLALPGDEDSDFGDVLVYLIPGLGVVLAAGGIVVATRRWRRRGGGGGGPAAAAPTSAASGRLDADLERYDL